MRPCRLPSRVTASARRRRHATSRMGYTRPLHPRRQVTVNAPQPRHVMTTINTSTQHPHGSTTVCASASSALALMAHQWSRLSAKSIKWKHVCLVRPAHWPSTSASGARACAAQKGRTATWAQAMVSGLLKVVIGPRAASHITTQLGFRSNGLSLSRLKLSNRHMKLCWTVARLCWMVRAQHLR